MKLMSSFFMKNCDQQSCTLLRDYLFHTQGVTLRRMQKLVNQLININYPICQCSNIHDYSQELNPWG